MVDIIQLKAIFMMLMFASSTIAGFFPLITLSHDSNKNLLSIGNCFAAGIFIIVGIAGLLPEAQKSFSESVSTSMPLAFVLSIAGFLLIFFFEKVLFTHSHSEDSLEHNLSPSLDLSSSTLESAPLKQLNKQNINSLHKNYESSALTSPIILTIALVVHSIFEGVAIGLFDSKSKTITLCIGVLMHNIPAALALGIRMQIIEKWMYVALMLCFVISSPASLLVGLFLSSLDLPVLKGVFFSISAGTFIYIGSSEILPEEMEKQNHKTLKFLAFLAGCLPLSMFFLFVND